MRVELDTTLLNADAADFEQKLAERVIGQTEAIVKATEVVQTYMAGFSAPDCLIGILLCSGPPVSARPGWSRPWRSGETRSLPPEQLKTSRARRRANSTDPCRRTSWRQPNPEKNTHNSSDLRQPLRCCSLGRAGSIVVSLRRACLQSLCAP
jgi:hypothetical protein